MSASHSRSSTTFAFPHAPAQITTVFSLSRLRPTTASATPLESYNFAPPMRNYNWRFVSGNDMGWKSRFGPIRSRRGPTMFRASPSMRPIAAALEKRADGRTVKSSAELVQVAPGTSVMLAHEHHPRVLVSSWAASAHVGRRNRLGDPLDLNSTTWCGDVDADNRGCEAARGQDTLEGTEERNRQRNETA